MDATMLRGAALVICAALVAGCGGGGGGGKGAGAATGVADGTVLAGDFTPPSGRGTAPLGAGLYGPWGVRMLTATSSDGLAWTRTNRVVSDQADVADVAIDSAGWLYIYYTGWTVGTEQNKSCVAISGDGGSTWAFKKLVFTGFDQVLGSQVDPDIQILGDGTFRLYVTVATPTADRRSYRTEGTDGVNFADMGVAFEPLGTGAVAMDPTTVQIGSTWHYFAIGAGLDAHWHATSADGRNFTYLATETWTDPEGTRQWLANATVFPGGMARMYTFSAGNGGVSPDINSFWSTDGTTWTADAGDRLTLDTSTGLESGGLKEGSVVRLPDGTYFMVYCAGIP